MFKLYIYISKQRKTKKHDDENVKANKQRSPT